MPDLKKDEKDKKENAVKLPENFVDSYWYIYPPAFAALKAQMKNGTIEPESRIINLSGQPPVSITPDQNGLAVINISGVLEKDFSFYGGTSMLWVKALVRAAANDPAVKGILLHIDSPGGTVSGTDDLAREVLAARKQKPVNAHIDDLGASAAYWIASQASRISANKTGLVGSIGTFAVVWDMEKFFNDAGVKVHAISTGPFKGLGIEGTPVTDEQLAYMEQMVKDLNEHFLSGVASGRGMPIAKVREAADGRVFLAKEAKSRGLIDAVETFDAAYDKLKKTVAKGRTEARIREARLESYM